MVLLVVLDSLNGGLKVKVNQLTILDESFENMAGWIVADVTLTDVKDGFGTIIPEDCFQLVREDYQNQYQANTRGLRAKLGWLILAQGKHGRHFEPNYATTRLLYGINNDWAVFDGAERRGIILFYAKRL